jgi:antitoxin VapB
MEMNIKSAEAHRLARELAALTGESLSGAVTEAVRERLERLRRGQDTDLAQQLRALRRDAAPRFKEPWRSVDHGELLYDERGLPR